MEITLSHIYKKVADRAYYVNIPLQIKAANGTKEDREAYNLEEQRLLVEFKSDLEAAFGLQDFTKKDLLFEIVYEQSPESFHTMVGIYTRLAVLVT